MDLLELVKFVMKNIYSRKGRMFLTLIGIVIGIFTFTFFVFVSNGLSDTITEQFNSLGNNVLGVKSITSQGMPNDYGISDKEVHKVQQVVKEAKYIAPLLINRLKIEYGRENNFAVTVAYKKEFLDDVIKDLDLKTEFGRVLKSNDRGAIMIGNKVAHNLFTKDIKIGTSIKINNLSFRVIGILESRGDLFIDNSVLISFNDMKKLVNSENYSAIRIKLYDGADIDYYKNAIDLKLNPNRNEQKFSVTSEEDIIEKFNSIIGLLTAIISFVSLIALLVGGVNLMNTMYSNVEERIREISVMKALGATNGTIRNLFLLESGILGLFGALIGYFSSYLLAKGLSILVLKLTGYNILIYFNVYFFGAVISFTVIFTIIFGTYPAIKASKINPAENLKDE